MIGIRADANKTIASGHIMRCLTIAGQLHNLGEEVTLFTADHNADDLIANYYDSTDSGFHHVVLDSKWDDLEDELPILTECLQVRGITTLLVDSYMVTYDYFKALSRVCKLVYIDDLHESYYPVDLLINYNGYAHDMNYEADYGKKSLLIGLQYAPLRPQFYDANNTSRVAGPKEHYNILLASGGGDKLGCMLSILQAVVSSDYFSRCSFHVIAGSLIDTKTDLDSLAAKYSNILIHESVTNMAELMCDSDIALTAAGTMLTECAACGLPAVFFITADNQRYEVDYWSHNGLMLYGGDMTDNLSSATVATLRQLYYLLDNPERLITMSEGLSNTTDGRGAIKIAQEIIKLCEQQ